MDDKLQMYNRILYYLGEYYNAHPTYSRLFPDEFKDCINFLRQEIKDMDNDNNSLQLYRETRDLVRGELNNQKIIIALLSEIRDILVGKTKDINLVRSDVYV